MRYLRDTKGKVFGPEAKEVWQTATCCGHMLDSNKPLTLEEIIAEHKRYDEQFPGEPFGFSDAEINSGLALLVQHGLAKEVA